MNRPLKIIFPAKLDFPQMVEDIFEVIAANATDDKRTANHIRLALSEVFNNAYLYGENDIPGAEIIVEICFNDESFKASVINNGQGLVDKQIKNKKLPPGDAESGRGLVLIKQICDKVDCRTVRGNKFKLSFEIKLDQKQKVEK